MIIIYLFTRNGFNGHQTAVNNILTKDNQRCDNEYFKSLKCLGHLRPFEPIVGLLLSLASMVLAVNRLSPAVAARHKDLVLMLKKTVTFLEILKSISF